MEMKTSKGSLDDLDSGEAAKPSQRKAKRVKKPQAEDVEKASSPQDESWTQAALPGNAIPDISSELDILADGVDTIRFDDKEDSIVVPTVFPGFNRAIRIGGAPCNAICLIHGPSKGGKTAFGLGLVVSFQQQGHFTVYIDAEHTLDKPFSYKCGVDGRQLEYVAPMTYEDTTAKVERYIENFRKGRDSGRINKNRCLLFIVDSITKLVPKDELEELSKVGKSFPLRALMNTFWLDRLTPIVGSLPILFCVFAHEKVKLDAGMFEKKYRIKGGEGLVYDSTMAIRLQAIGQKKVTRKGKKVGVGILHKGVIEKNKVGICSEQFNFVMGKGKEGYPIGIDHCANILEEAKLRGDESIIVRKSGAVWKHPILPDGRIKGDEKLIAWLRDRPEVVTQLITELNATAIDVDVAEDEGDDNDE